MKILVLQSELGVLRGGGENFTRYLFDAFARRGHHVAAVFAANLRGRYPIQLPAAIEPLPLSGCWSMDFGQGVLAATGRFLPDDGSVRCHWDKVRQALWWRTIRLHNHRFRRRVDVEFARRWQEFDAVYVHANPWLAQAAAKRRPTVLRLPGPVTAELKPVLDEVHAVCANGDCLNRIRPFLGDHASELPVGIDTERFRPGPTSMRTALGWTNGERVIWYVGRLVHVKGVDSWPQPFGSCRARRQISGC